MRAMILLTCAALVLSACTERKNRVAFNGVYFKGNVTAPRSDRHTFVASVRPVSAGLTSAREAARFEAIRHCIEYFGSSDIDWAIGPDTPDAQLRIERDALIYQGTCLE